MRYKHETTFNEYQREALQYSTYPGAGDLSGLTYATLGLNGEAGEVAEKLKKLLRDEGGVVSQDFKDATLKELGDVLWYVAACCEELGYAMEDAASASLAKLHDRAARGVLGGSGDDR